MWARLAFEVTDQDLLANVWRPTTGPERRSRIEHDFTREILGRDEGTGTGKGFGISATAARNDGFYLRFDHGGFVFRFSEPIGRRGLALVSPKSIMS